MNWKAMYGIEEEPGSIDLLVAVVQLAKVGAAAADSVSGIQHMNDAQCTLFEVIHALADETIEGVEMLEKKEPP